MHTPPLTCRDPALREAVPATLGLRRECRTGRFGRDSHCRRAQAVAGRAAGGGPRMATWPRVATGCGRRGSQCGEDGATAPEFSLLSLRLGPQAPATSCATRRPVHIMFFAVSVRSGPSMSRSHPAAPQPCRGRIPATPWYPGGRTRDRWPDRCPYRWTDVRRGQSLTQLSRPALV